MKNKSDSNIKTYKSLCPAKINLFLKVVGKRPDGFHALESLFALTDLTDELSVEISDNLSIEIDGEFLRFVDSRNNLFVKILDYFVREFGVTRDLKIKVKKNIPVGAGLGGGSSNAAYFIKALNEIFELNLDKKSLQKISLKFGSDIAFFFEEHAALVTGRGEEIEKYSFSPMNALLIHPKISLSTGEVFRNLNREFSEEIGVNELRKMSIEELLSLQNDLENPAIAALPLIKDIIDQLTESGADYVKMSGSGSACFGIFYDEEKLVRAEKECSEKFPEFFLKRLHLL